MLATLFKAVFWLLLTINLLAWIWLGSVLNLAGSLYIIGQLFSLRGKTHVVR
jgi:hypothetical protein